MNSQMKWFVSWGLGGSWVQELLFLWSWVSHPPCVNVCTNLEALWIPYYWYFVDASSHVCVHVCVCVWSVAHSCPALCNPMDCSLPGSSVHGIFQTRILEWVAISSRGSSLPRGQTVSPALTSGFFTTEPPGKPHSSSRHEYEQVITPLPASLPSMKDGR